MPITLFLSFSVTGKREWACSITKGINFSGESPMSITSIWERGIMISRACISETCITPSIMLSASESNRLRS